MSVIFGCNELGNLVDRGGVSITFFVNDARVNPDEIKYLKREIIVLRNMRLDFATTLVNRGMEANRASATSIIAVVSGGHVTIPDIDHDRHNPLFTTRPNRNLIRKLYRDGVCIEHAILTGSL